MHVLCVHLNFPAQFGHVGAQLARKGWRVSFVGETPAGVIDGVEENSVSNHRWGDADDTLLFSDVRERRLAHTDAVYAALRDRKLAEPFVLFRMIVGHSGFGSTLFLSSCFPTRRS